VCFPQPLYGLEFYRIRSGTGDGIDICVSRAEASIVGLGDFRDEKAPLARAYEPITYGELTWILCMSDSLCKTTGAKLVLPAAACTSNLPAAFRSGERRCVLLTQPCTESSYTEDLTW